MILAASVCHLPPAPRRSAPPSPGPPGC